MRDHLTRSRDVVPGPYGFGDLAGLMSRMTGDEKHSEAAASTVDALWVLYDRVLRVDPAMREDRDRFYLSKGHGPQAYYAVLCAKNFFGPELFDMFGAFRSPLGYHPDRALVPGVEISSGSLGHGLPLAVGTALGLRARGLTDSRIWVLLGDGEFDEGSNHEAVAYAARAGLDRLNAVVIDNHSATQGWPGGLETRFAAEGWATERVDGRDHDALEKAFATPHPGRPGLVVADVGAAADR
ncbi:MULTISPECIES: thiamine pyrophosphate-dependent enzyme [Streptomyces]|uniref:thiamine pyrophosphate-dependent enzyme n=1 Tax=Streptomyces TaxID=1883 RepID=UPI001E60AFA7|nr:MULTISPECIES: thiamine pyrophosphate-dependent enzyme [Streptomyces]UFQ13956.1 thiamine pyrophosphate-dependent enzyme [Streptomyces huasconensis]WCL83557.1 thiamine pyrophosphate-dependent enzyme [Streptomyces sp. JCM 35825]